MTIAEALDSLDDHGTGLEGMVRKRQAEESNCGATGA
jgi:hypothetical protein